MWVTYYCLLTIFYFQIQNTTEKGMKNLQWLNFLRIDSAKVLVKQHSFSQRNAERYLKLIEYFINFVRLNDLLFFIGCFGVLGRVVYFALNEIPLYFVIFCTLPFAFLSLLGTNTACYLHHYYLTM